MNVAEAAKKIGISRSGLYQQVAARKITFYRVGGKIILDDDDVNAFRASCRVAAAPLDTPIKPTRLKLKHIRLDASQLGSRDILKVFEVAETVDARVLLVGDR